DERIDALSPPRRRLLETVAAAGGPLRFEAAAQAAELSPEEARGAATALAEASLIRTLGPQLAQDLEVFHARIREAVVARLGGDEGRRRHATLAAVLEASGESDDA